MFKLFKFIRTSRIMMHRTIRLLRSIVVYDKRTINVSFKAYFNFLIITQRSLAVYHFIARLAQSIFLDYYRYNRASHRFRSKEPCYNRIRTTLCVYWCTHTRLPRQLKVWCLLLVFLTIRVRLPTILLSLLANTVHAMCVHKVPALVLRKIINNNYNVIANKH